MTNDVLPKEIRGEKGKISTPAEVLNDPFSLRLLTNPASQNRTIKWPTLEVAHLIRIRAKHQINAIPIGSARRPQA